MSLFHTGDYCIYLLRLLLDEPILLYPVKRPRKLGIDPTTLSRYVATGKVPAPKLTQAEGMGVHAWTEEEIDQVRQLLPKIANGRKTRYQKQGKKPRKRKSKP